MVLWSSYLGYSMRVGQKYDELHGPLVYNFSLHMKTSL